MTESTPIITPSPPTTQDVALPEPTITTPETAFRNVEVLDFNPKNVDVAQEPKNVDVLEMLISEKTALAGELAQYKFLCKQREQELEELQLKFNLAAKRADEVENSFIQEQKRKDEVQELNERLTRETSNLRMQLSEKSDYIEELKNCLTAERQKVNDMENKQTNSVLEEVKAPNTDNNDSRIESLMQTKFMYEQQIRDLQVMVQQLSQDKEQSNQQYQNYASHLNQEIASLNEKNAELAEQVSNLEGREKSLIDHVSGLEKQIQQTIKHQQQQTENKEEEYKQFTDEIKELKSQIESMNEEKMVFQLKIKSQEDKLEELSNEKLQTPKEEVMERVYSPEEDKKLLEKMESDKIAASRALIQNADLKQQLDELQMKFIELTNDKVELMTKLDSEMFTNKDIRQTYQQLKDTIDSLTEKLHFKDEEMIRLSHENNDLKLEVMELKHGKKEFHGDSCSSDHHDSSCSHDSSSEYHHHNDSSEHKHDHGDCHQHNENHSHGHHEGHNDDEQNDHHHHDHHNHESHQHDEAEHSKSCEDHIETPPKKEIQEPSSHSNTNSTPKLRPEAAMRKLEERFTKLMTEVADLTDDKQRLEHLVLQLQGETETIGEYISLYQTQRRVLKQRDYERSNYLQKIESERQELLKKMAYLNRLLVGLGIEVPLEAREESVIEPDPMPEPTTNGLEDRQQVLQKIQSIIHEMQEKSIIKDDLTKCGSGGSIAINHCSFCSGTLETV